MSYSRTSEPVKFERDCDAVMVPQGEAVTLPAGSSGYITQAQFDATAGKFREARTHATVADCQAATGRSKAMYQCMSNSYNHLIGCAEKHKP